MAKVETVEIEINGRILNVMPHMVADYMRFGATQTKRKVVKVPDELIAKTVIMPNDKLKTLLQLPKEPEVTITKNEPVKPDLLQEIKSETISTEEVKKTFEKPKHKAPVKSKSKR